MLDKSEYYHGAAIIRILEKEACQSVHRHGHLGYVVNNEIFVFLKYTTKVRTPWGFTFDQEDIDRCLLMEKQFKRVVLGLICGGDGVCALKWFEARKLLGDKPGRIAAGRKHNESYAVWGSADELRRKVPLNRWPSLLFDSPQSDAGPEE